MLNHSDIMSTVDMIDHQHLDIRTITMGISLLDCADPHPAACARQIQILMDDPQLARSLGQAGQKAMEPFRLEAVFPCVMAEYDRLLSPAPALV